MQSKIEREGEEKERRDRERERGADGDKSRMCASTVYNLFAMEF